MKISVAMCTYNGAPFVEEQIASIIEQTRPPHELVIRDDQSSDETAAIVDRLARAAPFPIRFAVNAERLGSTKNFEGAILACTGDLIALTDQDDVWVPHKLDAMASAFERDAALGALFSDSEVVDEQLRPLGYSMFDYCRLDAEKLGQVASDDIFDLVIKEPFVTGAALMFRRDLVRFISPIPPTSTFMIHDRWIATVTAAVSKLGYTEDRLILYRQHSRQQLGTPVTSSTSAERMRLMRRRDPQFYAGYLAFLKQLRDWVRANAGADVKPAFWEALDGRIRHLDARTDLPMQRLGRLRPIAAELRSGRYTRFSQGLTSAAKDLILK